MNSTAALLDAYSSDYVKLAWMVPPVERSGDDLHITNYNKVSFNSSNETHYGGDFNRKFCLVNRMFFFLCFGYALGKRRFVSINHRCFSMYNRKKV